MLTAAGSGYSRWGDIAVTRWREDATRDDWGSFVFLRDVAAATVWSAGYQPTRRASPTATTSCSPRIARSSCGTTGRSPPRLTSSCRPRTTPRSGASRSPTPAREAREIELTSYAELVLAPPAADARASGVLEAVRADRVSCPRRARSWRRAGRRSPEEAELWAAHFAVVEGEAVGEVEIETDRARFLGRGNDVVGPGRRDGRPAPVQHRRDRARPDLRAAPARARAGRAGRARRLLDRGRRLARGAARRYRQAPGRQRFRAAATLAWTQAQVQLRHLDVDAGAGQPLSAPGGTRAVRQPGAAPSSDTIGRGLAAQRLPCGRRASRATCRSCWCASTRSRIRGVVARGAARPRVLALKGLVVDLVILNERGASYVQDLQIALETLVRASRSADRTGGRGRSSAASSCCAAT